MKPLIAIVGNTGAGKSQLAVELAKAFNGEIINGDAMQMYQGLDIITNKHPLNEREGIPHHLLGTEPWDRQITVQDFDRRATAVIERIHNDKALPILVGGTHYYVQSLIAQNALIKDHGVMAQSSLSEASTSIAKKAFSTEQLAILEDASAVETELHHVDPVAAAKFHPNDTRRLRRALEIWYETGRRPSELYESQRSGSENEQLKLRYNVLILWVWCDRTVLTKRLDSRVLKMIDNGLINEINEMFEQYDPENTQTGIWQVLGFRQFLPYLENRTSENWETCVAKMQADTRQYAKKQTKWIRNKLGPLVADLGGDIALVDASDLTSWDSQVKARSFGLVQEWLKGSPFTSELTPAHLNGEIARRRQAFNRSQWIRHRCDVCSEYRETEVISMGDDEWSLHQQSKGHRAALKKKSATES